MDRHLARTFDVAVVDLRDELCDLAADAWATDHAAHHGGRAVFVAPADVEAFAAQHPATTFVMGWRPGGPHAVTGDEVLGLVRATGRPVVVVPVSHLAVAPAQG